MINVTREDILKGANFPEGGYWKAHHRDCINTFMNANYSKTEAIKAADSVIDRVAQAFTSVLNDPEMASYKEHEAVKNWLDAKNKDYASIV